MLWAEWQQHYVCAHGTCMQIHACTHPAVSLLCMAKHLDPNQPHLTALIWLTTVFQDTWVFVWTLGGVWDQNNYESFRKVLGNGFLFQCLGWNYLDHSLVQETCRTGGLCDLQGHPLTRKGSPHLPWSNPHVLRAHHPAKNKVHTGCKMTTLDKDFKKGIWEFFRALGSGKKQHSHKHSIGFFLPSFLFSKCHAHFYLSCKWMIHCLTRKVVDSLIVDT